VNSNQTARLRELLARPTAPFREYFVAALAIERLTQGGVPWFMDPVGNIVVGAASVAGYRRLLSRRSGEPLRIFVAHMDHPGFHGRRWLGRDRLAVDWLGGSPVRHLRGRRVWLAMRDGTGIGGRLDRVTLTPRGYSMARAEVAVDPGPRPPARQLFGGFNFRAPVWQQGRRLYARAADDLVGVFAILETARAAQRQGFPFLGLLTRAEEVGFVGAIGHLETGLLHGGHRPRLVVSLEASRTLPGARIGSGPVVRLGDRRSVFDPGALQVLGQVARRVLPGSHQRRIMDGGSCEASAAIAWGLPTVGISVPLGNYHNQGYEGGPDCPRPMGPAPEFVHLDDVDGLLRLCRGLLAPDLPWRQPWSSVRGDLRRTLDRYRRLLPPSVRRR
jgi:endoglucanase